MNRFLRLAAAGALLVANAGCVGVGVEGDVGYEGGYYEPYGYEYGGWGPGYGVGPWRGHDRGEWHGGEHPGGGAHAWHGPAGGGGHGMPSLPGRPRGR